jgi:hypothetical protein
VENESWCREVFSLEHSRISRLTRLIDHAPPEWRPVLQEEVERSTNILQRLRSSLTCFLEHGGDRHAYTGPAVGNETREG